MVDSVDVFIGTGGVGHCFPHAATPFGLVQPGPDMGHNDWKHCAVAMDGEEDRSYLEIAEWLSANGAAPEED